MSDQDDINIKALVILFVLTIAANIICAMTFNKKPDTEVQKTAIQGD